MDKRNRKIKSNNISVRRSFQIHLWEEEEKDSIFYIIKEYLNSYLAVFLLFFTIWNLFFSDHRDFFLLLMASGVLALFYQWMLRQGRVERILIRTAFFVIVVGGIFFSNMRQAFLGLLTQTAEILAQKGISIGDFSAALPDEFPAFLCSVLVLMCIVECSCELYRKNKYILWIIITGILSAFTVIGGLKPVYYLWILYTIWSFSILSLSTQGSIISILLVGFIGAFICFMTVLSDDTSVLENRWNTWRYHINESILPEGQLKQAAYAKRDESTALKVKMDQKYTFYLRGFVGICYDNDTWTNDRKYLNTFEEGMDGFRFLGWLHSKGFYGRNQIADLLKSNHAASQSNFEIENIGANRKYLYLPYECTTAISDYEKQHKAALGPGEALRTNGIFGVKAYNGQTYAPAYNLIPENITLENERVTLYEQYIQTMCLSLKKDEKDQISQILGDTASDKKDVEDQVAYVQSWLKNNISYNEHLGRIPEDSDFITYFLKEKKQGYDVWYASAAVMLFRYLGIPSRYVEGYIITKEDIRLSGTDSTVNVSNKDAHAWAEIYVKNTGWIPVEVTPGYEEKMDGDYIKPQIASEESSSKTEEKKEEKKPDATSETTENTERQKTTENQETTENKEAGEDQEATEDKKISNDKANTNKKNKIENQQKKMILVGLLLLILFAVFFVKILCLMADRRWKYGEDNNLCVIKWYRKLEKIIEKKSAKRKKNLQDNRLIILKAYLIQADPNIDEKHLNRAFAIRQKAIYSGKQITQAERNDAAAFFEKEWKYIKKKGNI